MKHKCFAAVVLAAALLLTGCGGAAAQSAAAAAVQTAQKERITDQYTLEKNISGVWEEDTGQYISVHVSVHVPQLECDSPDAASINDELNDIYAEHFREYEAYEEAGQPGSEYPQIGVNWDAYWYGDCVSLVMSDRSGGTAPWFYNGWCFDFATGQQITTAEMLQRMGLDPDTVQQQVQLKGTQATITVSPAPKTTTWDTELNLRLEQARTYPILGSYNEYVDVCIGQQTDSVFHPVVYLLTKDGVVEYVDVLRCLLFGNAMICQDPIYIANNGVSLERSGNSKVNLRRKDGSVLELADLSSEWSVQDIPYSITGSFNCTNGNWLELSSDGSVQLGVQNNSRIDQGDAAYLGVVPEGMVLAIFTDTGLDFVAAFKMDLYDNLTMTMIDGQNPFAEGETQLQMTRSYD